MNSLVYEWVGIQNIAVEKPYNKMMIEELGFDICTLLPLDKCQLTKDLCKIEKNRCISSSRVKKMHTQKTHIVSKTTELKYEVIQSNHMDDVSTLSASIQMYYVAVRSVSSKHMFVLFSSGIVLTANDFIENKNINDGLIDMIMTMKRYLLENPTKKLVLGGHSMGATLALYAGYLFKKHDPDMFRTNVVVLGTGIAKSVSDEMAAMMNDLPNVHQFISGEVRSTKTANKLLYDCLRDKGTMQMYSPLKYISKMANEDDTFSYNEHVESDLPYKLEVGNENQCKKVHMWSYYSSILGELYKKQPVFSLSKSKKSRTQTKKLRTQKKSRMQNNKSLVSTKAGISKTRVSI